MFDFAKTVVCGIGKVVVGVLAVFGGGIAGLALTSDTFANGLGKACVDAINEELESEGD